MRDSDKSVGAKTFPCFTPLLMRIRGMLLGKERIKARKVGRQPH